MDIADIMISIKNANKMRELSEANRGKTINKVKKQICKKIASLIKRQAKIGNTSISIYSSLGETATEEEQNEFNELLVKYLKAKGYQVYTKYGSLKISW